jgi:hypothetical protein
MNIFMMSLSEPCSSSGAGPGSRYWSISGARGRSWSRSGSWPFSWSTPWSTPWSRSGSRDGSEYRSWPRSE